MCSKCLGRMAALTLTHHARGPPSPFLRFPAEPAAKAKAASDSEEEKPKSEPLVPTGSSPSPADRRVFLPVRAFVPDPLLPL